MMRGTPGMRLLLAVLSPVFLGLCLYAIRDDGTRSWVGYQTEFNRRYVALAEAKLEAVQSQNGTVAEAEQARWRRVVREVSHAEPEIAQIYLEDIKVVDRCVTCHRGIDNALFADAPQPFRTHSGEALKHHDVNGIGCTPCHGGQGGALTADEAHGANDRIGQGPMLAAAHLETSCVRCHEATHGLQGAAVADRGSKIFMEKGCYGCHDVEDFGYRPKFGPALTQMRSKLQDPARWAYAWIKDPRAFNPGTAMPDYKLSDEDAATITAFLMTQPTDESGEPLALDDASVKEGERLFVERGCRGCHGVEEVDDQGLAARVPHMAGIGSKVTPEWLDRWIADPRAYNPDTPMPKVEVTDAERHALIAYLMTLKRGAPLPPTPDLSALDPEQGRQLVARYECFGCHAIAGGERMRPSIPALREFAQKPMADVDFARTTDVPRTKWDWLARKLRDPKAYETDKIRLLMPTVPLTDEEAQALITYILGLDRPTMPARVVRPASRAQGTGADLAWMLARLNCNGCHQVNEQDPRIARFSERRNATPPTLDGVAQRLQSHALFQFVLAPTRMRPWLGMRMPDFGLTEPQVQALVDGFTSAAGIDNPYLDVPTVNVVGPPLTTLPTKVPDPRWPVAWLQKPSRLRPGTLMPDVDLTPADAEAVVRYLYANAEPVTPVPGVERTHQWRGGDQETGKQLFVSRGCRGCHAIAPEDSSIMPRVPHLGDVGLKVDGDWLFGWVTSPRAYDPHTLMPKIELDDDEARHLVAYLLSRRAGADVIANARRPDLGADPAAGRDVIERFGCPKCHAVKGFPAPAAVLSLVPETPITGRETVLRNGRALVENLQCRGCHEIEGSGGVIAAHLDRKTMRPPSLTTEGARVQTSWLVEYLQRPVNLRPWLSLRMPDFGMSEIQARALARYFAALADVPAADEPLPSPSAGLVERGMHRVGLLRCGQCHALSPDGEAPSGVLLADWSINLAMAKTRLRPSWMQQFLARPKEIAGMHTRMPTVFYTVEGRPKVAEPERDIEAVVSYLLQMTEPPDVTLARLQADRDGTQEPVATDWIQYDY